MNKDWIVTEDGHCQPCPTLRDWDLLESPYYFHRFLTEVENLLRQTKTTHQCDRLPVLRQLVRKLIVNSYWIRTQRPTFLPAAPTALLNLYDETGYPLTVQIEALKPGASSSIHTHGTWGIVAILQGQEKHTFWQRSPEPDLPNKIVCVAEKTLSYGEVISFVPEAIHRVQAIGKEPLVTFNLYGETMSEQRFEFDAIAHQAKRY
ncbi:cupin [cf. Phormidesmis sp. LEGE 11477]|uniref:cysteine dioxygenase family protein n=1 Tax=cf. Phormidesmis sp. LEGE 11477 TaxID=1828680 RepID=UPI001882E12F|nr:cupin [cf. Phormidesmis sp. LEGE 11477]MBE9059848.1 cupin [cf. Phormidesmis sp. LEGE 11477]